MIHRITHNLALAVGLCLLVGVRTEAVGEQAQHTSQAAPSPQSETLPAGVRHFGGGVSAPRPIYQVDWVHTKEDQRLASPHGVLISLIIDEQGRPINVHVVRGDMELGGRIVDAVKQYRYKPAMENGKPVMVDINMIFNIG